ncbi:hypothetical protein [Microbispora sp. H13382]|uniref:hypothetical protein n=1 Tax=Microbispora sp. H13382 TaxID=2729112 RepID=UPI0016021CE1|nr:hypothetical protein [Microbispora sp. H13382]
MDDQWMRRVWPPTEEEPPPSEEGPTRPYGAPGGPPSSPQWPSRPYGGREAEGAEEDSFTRAYRLPGDVTEERRGRSGPVQGGFATRPYLMPDRGEAGQEGRRPAERPEATGGAGGGLTRAYRLPGDATPEGPAHSGAAGEAEEGFPRAYRLPGEVTPEGPVHPGTEGPGGGFTRPYGAPVSERRSADRPVWPSLGLEPAKPEDDLPPSARRYRAPETPPRRMPRWLQRLLVGGLALVCSAAVIGAVVVTVLHRAESAPPTMIHDQIAGVAYTLPPEWREGVVAPVTGFTSSAARGDSATVMARPGDRVDPPNLRSAVIDLADLYTQLLLHGDKVEVLDDRAVTVGGRPGHTRAVRAEYTDVVNEPAFMRVTLLTRPDGGSTVLLGLAHPDDPRSRAEIEGLMWGAR